MTLPLSGCTVVVTREERGELGRLLDAQGADVAHVPLIEVVDADPGELAAAWELEPEWVIVTSAAGAERIAAGVSSRPHVRLAAVGTATARRLEERCGRPADLVPDQQLAAALVEEFVARNDMPRRVLVAHADRAAPTLVDGLRAAGHEVTAVVAYRTRLRTPTADDRAVDRGCRCRRVRQRVGGAGLGRRRRAIRAPRCRRSWWRSGRRPPRLRLNQGSRSRHIAADHSLAGIIDELIDARGQSPPT